MTHEHDPSHERRLARFDATFRQHYEAVRRHAFRCGAAEPDEAASEAFAALWRHLDAVSVGAERAWLLSAVRKQAANNRRGAKRRENLNEALVQNASRNQDTVPAVATDSVVQETLESLSSVDREVLVLAAWDGLPPSEIAQVLDISKNSVAVRLHRAKRRFRREYIRRQETLLMTTCSVEGGADAH
jgi:RNA polymerase sigma-70 factor, ECF subfamily